MCQNNNIQIQNSYYKIVLFDYRKVSAHTMNVNVKTMLQLDLSSNFNKNLYRIKKNTLHLSQPKHQTTEYKFNNMYRKYFIQFRCYTSQDINSSIIYDIVLDYSQKKTSEFPSAQSINIPEDIPTRLRNSHQGKGLGRISQIDGVQNSSIMSQSSPQANTHTSMCSLPQKQPQSKYTILFDQIPQTGAIEQLIRQISATEIFKKQKIKIGHFLVHQNGIYDFHRSKSMYIESETQREELEKEYMKLHGSIEDNFMWIYNREINLCEEIKLSNIPQLLNNISYISSQQFTSLSKPALGIQLAQNLTKAQQIKHKQLQNKKILQIFILNIGTRLRISIILFNYNKNYTFSAQQQKQLGQFFMMYGVLNGDIKYQNIKIEIINMLMKGLQGFYYVMYFPGRLANTELNVAVGETMQKRNNSNIFRSTLLFAKQLSASSTFQQKQKSNEKKLKASTLIPSLINSELKQYRQKRNTLYNINCKLGSKVNVANLQQIVVAKQNNSYLLQSKVSNFPRSPNKSTKTLSPQKTFFSSLNSIFTNYTTLLTKDKDTLQRIIKQYLHKKQTNLKQQLEKIKERIKQLKLNQRIEESQVQQLKIRCTKALEKMSQSVIQLQKLGICNVQRHMDWLRISVEEKKALIRDEQQQIEEINRKIIESRKSHEYFYSKMLQFRDCLQQKYKKLIQVSGPTHKKSGKENDENQQASAPSSPLKSHLNDLSLAQLQQLQQHKQKLKAKLVEKLKNSSQKKSFFQTLAQLKNKISKLELTRLQQKYFDLLHD